MHFKNLYLPLYPQTTQIMVDMMIVSSVSQKHCIKMIHWIYKQFTTIITILEII